jgi:membrane protease YdiL (CAAX protease family)
MMRGVGVSVAKILGFLGIWAALIAAVVMTAVGVGGQDWFNDIEWRVFVEIGGTVVTLAALVFMAFVIDKRGAGTLGFNATRFFDLVTGTVLGAAIFAAPVALLVAMGAAKVEPDLSGFSANALAISLVLCLFNVITQELLVRSYIFQELWTKYGAAIAIGVTTAIFLALHAAPISQGQAGLIAAANILVASVMLGLAYVRTNALWLPIGIHLGWNALQGPVLGINVTGQDIGLGYWRVFTFDGDPLLTGGAMGVEGGLVGLVGPLLGLIAVALIWKRKASAV